MEITDFIDVYWICEFLLTMVSLCVYIYVCCESLPLTTSVTRGDYIVRNRRRNSVWLDCHRDWAYAYHDFLKLWGIWQYYLLHRLGGEECFGLNPFLSVMAGWYAMKSWLHLVEGADRYEQGERNWRHLERNIYWSNLIPGYVHGEPITEADEMTIDEFKARRAKDLHYKRRQVILSPKMIEAAMDLLIRVYAVKRTSLLCHLDRDEFAMNIEGLSRSHFLLLRDVWSIREARNLIKARVLMLPVPEGDGIGDILVGREFLGAGALSIVKTMLSPSPGWTSLIELAESLMLVHLSKPGGAKTLAWMKVFETKIIVGNEDIKKAFDDGVAVGMMQFDTGVHFDTNLHLAAMRAHGIPPGAAMAHAREVMEMACVLRAKGVKAIHVADFVTKGLQAKIKIKEAYLELMKQCVEATVSSYGDERQFSEVEVSPEERKQAEADEDALILLEADDKPIRGYIDDMISGELAVRLWTLVNHVMVSDVFGMCSVEQMSAFRVKAMSFWQKVSGVNFIIDLIDFMKYMVETFQEALAAKDPMILFGLSKIKRFHCEVGVAVERYHDRAAGKHVGKAPYDPEKELVVITELKMRGIELVNKHIESARKPLDTICHIESKINNMLGCSKPVPFGLLLIGRAGTGKSSMARELSPVIATLMGLHPDANITSVYQPDLSHQKLDAVVTGIVMMNEVFAVTDESMKQSDVSTMQMMVDVNPVYFNMASLEEKADSEVKHLLALATSNSTTFMASKFTGRVEKLDRRYLVVHMEHTQKAIAEAEAMKIPVGKLMDFKTRKDFDDGGYITYSVGYMDNSKAVSNTMNLLPQNPIVFKGLSAVLNHLGSRIAAHVRRDSMRRVKPDITRCPCGGVHEQSDCLILNPYIQEFGVQEAGERYFDVTNSRNAHWIMAFVVVVMSNSFVTSLLCLLYAAFLWHYRENFEREFRQIPPEVGDLLPAVLICWQSPVVSLVGVMWWCARYVTTRDIQLEMVVLRDAVDDGVRLVSARAMQETARMVLKAGAKKYWPTKLLGEPTVQKVGGIALGTVLGALILLRPLLISQMPVEEALLQPPLTGVTDDPPGNVVRTTRQGVPWFGGKTGTVDLKESEYDVEITYRYDNKIRICHGTACATNILLVPLHLLEKVFGSDRDSLEKGAELTVTQNKISSIVLYEPSLVWKDPKRDLAAIFVPSHKMNLVYPKFGVSKRGLHAGGRQLTESPVQARHAHFDLGYYPTPFEKGDCGRTVLNEEGEVIALHVARLASGSLIGCGVCVGPELINVILAWMREKMLDPVILAPEGAVELEFKEICKPGLHPRSDLSWMQDEKLLPIEVMGHKPITEKPTSIVSKSELHQYFGSRCGEYGAPILGKATPVDGVYQSPVTHRMKSLYDGAKVEMELLIECVHEYVESVTPREIKELEPLNFEQSLCGDKRNTFINGRDDTKGLGPTMKMMGITKKKFYTRTKDGGTELCPQFARECEKIWRESDSELIGTTIMSASVKSEALPMRKVRARKGRIFMVGDAAFHACVRRVTLPFNAHLLDHPQESSIYGAINPGGKEWEALYRIFGKDLILESDQAYYDTKQCFIKWGTTMFYVLMAMAAGWSDQSLRRLRNLLHRGYQQVVILEGNVFRLVVTMPSGKTLTLCENSIGHKLLWGMVYKQWEIRVMKRTPAKGAWLKALAMALCGDDSGLKVPPYMTATFTLEFVAERFKVMGYEITAGSKDGPLGFVTREQFTFLKRKFVEDEFGVRAPLDEESIWRAINYWCDLAIPERERSIAVLAVAQREFFMHGREKFDAFQKDLDDLPFAVRRLSYDELLEDFKIGNLRVWQTEDEPVLEVGINQLRDWDVSEGPVME